MDNQPGTGGLYPWFPEHGTDLIHPDDLQKVLQNNPYGAVFKCAGKDGDFVVLRSNGLSFRAKPLLLKTIPAPPHEVGDTVTILKKGQLHAAEVVGIGWHFKNGTHTFAVAANGKKLKKRYYATDFVHDNCGGTGNQFQGSSRGE